MNRFPRTRAFIAAPLLGTLIFLVAVMFVVHVTQVEKAEVARIVHDVYYNRVVTTLEDFRSDLGTIFSVSVARAVEQYLSNQCWQAFAMRNAYQQDLTSTGDTTSYSPAGITGTNGVSDFDNLAFCGNTKPPNAPNQAKWNQCNPGDPTISPICAEQCNRVLDYHELRYQKCTLVSSLLRNGVCTLDPKYGIPGWIKTILDKSAAGDSCTWASPSCKAVQSAYFDVAPDGSCTSRPGCKCDTTGADCPLSPAAGSTISLFRFEGIKFSIPNKDQATALTSQTACDFSAGTADPSKLVTDQNMVYLDSSGTTCWGVCLRSDTTPQCTDASSHPALNSLGTKNACAFSDGTPCAGRQGKVEAGSGSNLCQQLIGDSLFDCRQFAEKDDVNSCKSSPTPGGAPNPDCPFRCCKTFANQALLEKSSLRDVQKKRLMADVGLCCADAQILKLRPQERKALGCSTSESDSSVPSSLDEAKSTYIPGCEAGTFLVNINPTATSQLVNDIPRAQALDESGNVLSGSALADAPTRVAIQYPLYSYLDTAFRVYSPVAYGAIGNPTDFTNPDANSRLHTPGLPATNNPGSFKQGVSQGVCYGTKCDAVDISRGFGSTDPFTRKKLSSSTLLPLPAGILADAAKSEAAARTLGAANFVNAFFLPSSLTSICRAFRPASQGGVCELLGTCQSELWINWGSNVRRKLCPDIDPDPAKNLGLLSTTLPNPASLYDGNFFVSTGIAGTCDNNPNPSAAANKCAYITSLRYTLELHDLNPAHLVNGAQGTGSASPYNDFCFYLWPELFTPCKINPADGRCIP